MSVESVVEELELAGEPEQSIDENMRFNSYTFIDVESNERRSFEHMVLSESQIVQGGLVVFAMESEKPRFYAVKSVDDVAQRVELVTPKNAYGKIALMFALLGITWFVLDYLMKLIV